MSQSPTYPVKCLPITRQGQDKLNYTPSILGLMSPRDFIELTVGTDRTWSVIFDETKIPLAEYQPDDNAQPWLRVAVGSGRLVGHNGRHRAAMCFREGHRAFPVLLIFQQFSLKRKKYVTIQSAELPTVFRAQFIPTVAKPTVDCFQPIYWF